MSDDLEICLICLRTDKKLREIDNRLSEFHDGFCGSVISTADPQYCSECEYLLKKFYNFQNKCMFAIETLLRWKKSRHTFPKIPHLIHKSLPPSSLGPWALSTKRYVFTYVEPDSDNTKTNTEQGEISKDMELEVENSPGPKLSTVSSSKVTDIVPKKIPDMKSRSTPIVGTKGNMLTLGPLILCKRQPLISSKTSNSVSMFKEIPGNNQPKAQSKTTETENNPMSLKIENCFSLNTNTKITVKDETDNDEDVEDTFIGETNDNIEAIVKETTNHDIEDTVKETTNYNIDDIVKEETNYNIDNETEEFVTEKSLLKEVTYNNTEAVKEETYEYVDTKMEVETEETFTNTNNEIDVVKEETDANQLTEVTDTDVNIIDDCMMFDPLNMSPESVSNNYASDRRISETNDINVKIDSDVIDKSRRKRNSVSVNEVKVKRRYSKRKPKVPVDDYDSMLLPNGNVDRQRLKEKIVGISKLYDELKTEVGKVVDKEYVLACLDHKVPESMWQMLWRNIQHRSHYKKKYFIPQAVKFFEYIQRKYKRDSEIAPVCDVLYLNTEEKMLEEYSRREQYEWFTEFRCDVCVQGFKYKVQVEKHMKLHEKNAGKFVCKLCKTRYKTKKILEKHQHLHETVYKCKLCPMITSYWDSISNHTDVHTGKRHACEICDATFITMEPDVQIPSTSSTPMETDDIVPPTSAIPFAVPHTPHNAKAQRQSMYRKRKAAERTPAEAADFAKAAAERQRRCKQRRLANSALDTGTLESATVSAPVVVERTVTAQTSAQRQRAYRQRRAAQIFPQTRRYIDEYAECKTII